MQFCNRPSLRLSFQLGRRQHQPSLAPNQKESWAWFHSWILCSSWSKRQMENLDITPLSWDFWGILFPFPWFPNINVWKFGLKMGNAISHSGPQRKWSGDSFIALFETYILQFKKSIFFSCLNQLSSLLRQFHLGFCFCNNTTVFSVTPWISYILYNY